MLVSQVQACFNSGMDKSEAIRLLGGSISAAARAVGITTQAVSQWPDPLPPAIADRVQAALWRASAQSPKTLAPLAPHNRRSADRLPPEQGARVVELPGPAAPAAASALDRRHHNDPRYDGDRRRGVERRAHSRDEQVCDGDGLMAAAQSIERGEAA